MSRKPLVVVVGAGPAGLAAACTLAEAGLAPMLLESRSEPGGAIWRMPSQSVGTRVRLKSPGSERVERLRARFQQLRERIDFYPETVVVDVSRERLWAVAATGEIDCTPWDRLIVATGALDRILPVPGWTLPGVVTLGGAQTALKLNGCAVGARVAFFGTGPLLYLAAAQYVAAGIEVAVVADTSRLVEAATALPALCADAARLALGLRALRILRRARVPVLRGVWSARIEGHRTVEAIVLERRHGFWRFSCDAVALGFGLVPQLQLLELLGAPMRFDRASDLWLPAVDAAGRTPIQGLYVAGDAARPLGVEAAVLAGERVAYAVLEDEGRAVDPRRIAQLEAALARHRKFAFGLVRAFRFPSRLEAAVADDTVVCRCEGVTAGAIRGAVTELDACTVSEAKALTRVGMGRCQGRLCGLTAARILAAARAVPLEAVGRLRPQAPILPLPVDIRRAAPESVG